MNADQHTKGIDAATALEASGDYRVLRKLGRRVRFCEADGTPTKAAIVLDIETTGLSHAGDEIIELGMVKFDFSANTRVFDVTGEFSSLREPGIPIPAAITELTGITAEMWPASASTRERRPGSSMTPC